MSRRYLLAAVLYCAAIFALSSRPAPVENIPLFEFLNLDKAAHALLYGGLAVIVSLGLRRSAKPVRPLAQFLVPILFAGLYGVSDEIHQYFVPLRSCDVLDALADFTGAVMAQVALFGWWAGRFWLRQRSSPR